MFDDLYFPAWKSTGPQASLTSSTWGDSGIYTPLGPLPSDASHGPITPGVPPFAGHQRPPQAATQRGSGYTFRRPFTTSTAIDTIVPNATAGLGDGSRNGGNVNPQHPARPAVSQYSSSLGSTSTASSSFSTILDNQSSQGSLDSGFGDVDFFGVSLTVPGNGRMSPPPPSRMTGPNLSGCDSGGSKSRVLSGSGINDGQYAAQDKCAATTTYRLFHNKTPQMLMGLDKPPPTLLSMPGAAVASLFLESSSSVGTVKPLDNRGHETNRMAPDAEATIEVVALRIAKLLVAQEEQLWKLQMLHSSGPVHSNK